MKTARQQYTCTVKNPWPETRFQVTVALCIPGYELKDMLNTPSYSIPTFQYGYDQRPCSYMYKFHTHPHNKTQHTITSHYYNHMYTWWTLPAIQFLHYNTKIVHKHPTRPALHNQQVGYCSTARLNHYRNQLYMYTKTNIIFHLHFVLAINLSSVDVIACLCSLSMIVVVVGPLW